MTVLMLRVASVISFLFAAGHTLGGRSSWSPVGETEVLGAMKTYAFMTEGVRRTYHDFYIGFGFVLSVYLVMQGVLLWQLASYARMSLARARPMIATFVIAAAVITVLTWAYILPVPVYFWVAIDVALGIALFGHEKRLSNSAT